MSSALCFNLDQSRNLSSSNGLKCCVLTPLTEKEQTCTAYVMTELKIIVYTKFYVVFIL